MYFESWVDIVIVVVESVPHIGCEFVIVQLPLPLSKDVIKSFASHVAFVGVFVGQSPTVLVVVIIGTVVSVITTFVE